MRPTLLDLFCRAGGAGRGYQLAGFDITGVDIEPIGNYPGTFVQGDALEYLAAHGHEFDAIHASPPCQWSSNLSRGTNAARRGMYVNLIPQTRELLAATGVPSIIENVQGAAVRRDYTLCGEMFGLGVLRHRYFEVTGFIPEQPKHRPHRGRVQGWRHGIYYPGPYLAVYGEGGGKGSIAQWQVAMGIDWMTDRKDLAEAIPPRYTQCIGAHLLAQLLAI